MSLPSKIDALSDDDEDRDEDEAPNADAGRRANNAERQYERSLSAKDRYCSGNYELMFKRSRKRHDSNRDQIGHGSAKIYTLSYIYHMVNGAS